MGETRFNRASVLVFDPNTATRRANRAALEALDFGAIEMLSEWRTFSAAVHRDSHDLIIAEAFTSDADACGLVRAIRDGDAGTNPFVSIILTCWPRRETDIHLALNCGTDDLLLRPFSTGQLVERVKALATSQRPYVVTSDYVGPDRRRAGSRGKTPGAFTPPNMLKARSDGRTQVVRKTTQTIAALRERVSQERVRRLAGRVGAAVKLRLNRGEGDSADEYLAGVEDIDRSARELRRHIRIFGLWPEADTTVAELLKLTTKMIAQAQFNPDPLARAAALATQAAEQCRPTRPTAAPSKVAEDKPTESAAQTDTFDLDDI